MTEAASSASNDSILHCVYSVIQF